MNNPKNFIQKSYDRSNQKGIDLFVPFLEKRGYEVDPIEETQDIDIVARTLGVETLFEIETKTHVDFTTRDTFPFSTVSFLGRKKKWKDKNFWYIIICLKTNWFVCCNSKTIYNEDYKEEIYIDKYERVGKDIFYRVPKELCFFHKL